MPNPIAERYRAATREAGGDCPIEAGVLGRLADHERPHGRLPGDRTPKCGCWPQENASVIPLPTPAGRTARPSSGVGRGGSRYLCLGAAGFHVGHGSIGSTSGT